MARRPLGFLLVPAFGAVCSFAGWTAAQAGESAILKPKSTEAIAIPALSDPPARCDEQHAGWMYLDTEIGDAIYPCVCVKNNSKVWDWIVVGAMPGRMCE
jgi:hypothetical protein